MEYRVLGRTGVAVSALGFGGAPAGLTDYLGHWQADAPAARASVTEAVRDALAMGVTYFDTAPGYGDGLSEEIIGAALGADRQRVFLATKTSRPNWNPDGIRAELEASLRRLRADHVDLLQFHGAWHTNEDAALILERGGLETYEQLRAEGKVRFLGFTAEGPTGAVERLIASGRFDTMMICFNVCHQTPGAYRNRAIPPETLLSRARAQNMGVITMRTLSSGLFQRWLAQVAPAVASAVDWNAALLGFALSHPQVDVALVGMRAPEEVARNALIVASQAYRVDMPSLHDGYAARATEDDQDR